MIPSPAFSIDLDGGEQNTPEGDRLKLDSGGLAYTLAGGTFSVAGRKPVNFRNFEVLETSAVTPPPMDVVDLTGNFGAVTTLLKGTKYKLTFEFNLTNAGSVGAGKTVTSYYLSSDTMVDGADLPIKNKKSKPVAPGQQVGSVLKKTLPAGLSPAGMFVIAVTDSTGVAQDGNPANNTVVYGPLM